MSTEEYKRWGVDIPPNLEKLSVEEFKRWEEDAYHSLYKRKWSFLPGDPRLKSGDQL